MRTVVWVLAAIVCLSSIVTCMDQKKACDKKNGTLVRGLFMMVCIPGGLDVNR